ncbi:MAG: MurT ligase domain-containing protein [Alicyclobacillus sp.]|nr:MurT ligase domain-containing protein [Alicyclobacillus sp.]
MKLGIKITIFMVALAILATVVTALLAVKAVRESFDFYVGRQMSFRMQWLQAELAEFYREKGSWDDVQSLFEGNRLRRGYGYGRIGRGGSEGSQGMMGDGPGGGPMGMMGGPGAGDALLSDAAGTVIASSNRSHLGKTENQLLLKDGLDIKVNGIKVGTLYLVNNLHGEWEQEFLNSVTRAAAWAGVTAVLLALFLGILISRHLTGPLGSLSAAAREGRFCPHCGRELFYAYYHYSQLGNYRCPGCGFSRPFADVEGTEVSPGSHRITCRLRSPAGSHELVIPVPGLYNLYNGLAAFTAGLLLGVEPEGIIRALAGYTPATGRMERFRYRDKPVLLNLVKNPTGFNEGLTAMLAAQGTKDVFIAINDNDADGKDISWLWDVDFERLGEDHASLLRFVCSGLRGEEMAVRLRYCGVPLDKISINRDMQQAIESVLAGGAGTSYLFCTYTALWPVHQIVNQLASKEGHDDHRMPSVS